MIQVLREVLIQKILGANLAKVEDEQSDCESQVSCESPENDIAYADESLADDEWIQKNKGDFCLIGWLNL